MQNKLTNIWLWTRKYASIIVFILIIRMKRKLLSSFSGLSILFLSLINILWLFYG